MCKVELKGPAAGGAAAPFSIEYEENYIVEELSTSKISVRCEGLGK